MPAMTPLRAAFQPAGPSVGQIRQALEALPSSQVLEPAEAEALYAAAKRLVGQGQYQAAFGQFCLLTTFRPTHTKYLNGLALTHRLLGRHQEALDVYYFALQLEPGQPRHALNVAECLMLLQRREDALAALQVVMRYCKGRDTAPGVLARAQALADLLSSKA